MKSLFPFLLCIVCLQAQAQNIVVSEYFNAADAAHEWTELLVTADNISMAGLFLTDNTSSQDGRQGGIRFRDIPLWRHVRRGTIIVIHHRSEGITDSDPQDGFLELQASNPAWFDQVKFSTSNFEWNVLALNIAQAGEIIELLSPDSLHIHSISHTSSPGPYYAAMTDPKPNYPGTCPTTGSISIQPGSQLSDYGTNVSPVLSIQGTQGLPNGIANRNFWRLLRQPDALPNPMISIQPDAAYTRMILQWQALPDAYPGDSMQHCVILRNKTPLFLPPSDGKLYQPGQMIGQAVVVAILSSAAITFTDSIMIRENEQVYYRIYPFRYGKDNQDHPDPARGPAYSEEGYGTGSIRRELPDSLRLMAQIPPVSGIPGQKVNIPVEIMSPDIEKARIHSIITSLYFNGSLLLPDSVSAGSGAPGFSPHLVEIHPGSLVITLESADSLLRNGTLFTLHCTALLGNVHSTALLPTFSGLPLPVQTETVSEGPFMLSDTCTTQRLIDLSGITLFRLAGNPVTEEAILHYATPTDDPVFIELYNTLGKREKTIGNGSLPPGEHTLAFDVRMLSNALYYLVMRNGIRRYVLPVMVQK